MITSPYNKPRITPPAEHPRLMLTAADLPRIQQNIASPQNADAVRMFRELCELEIRGVGATPEFGSYHLKEYIALEAKALDALLSDDAARGRCVIDTLMFLLRGACFEGMMRARYSGHLIFVASEVYDWCYKWLEDGERQEIIERCEAFAEAYFEMGYPPQKQAAISGHGNEKRSVTLCRADEASTALFCKARLHAHRIGGHMKQLVVI